MSDDAANTLTSHGGAAASPVHDPAVAYAQFLAAIAGRDIDLLLARVSESYGDALRRCRTRAKFARLLELWCEHFPRHVDTIACFADGDSAILETVHDAGGEALAGRVTLQFDAGMWRVTSESCADGSRRIPLNGLLACADAADSTPTRSLASPA